MSETKSVLKKFDFEHPFDYRNATYDSIEFRRPRVRDLKSFVKNAETDAVGAMEKVLANLSDLDEKVIAEIDLEDFAPIKKWFEGFLKFISDASENS
ncbi:phage tail assembly protein [Methylobacterium sp. WL120]|uniref:phage tail assembly protein n=1 Tax=Methylobacterium sp. WL120 TaxID=2603887 RepID=UPI0011C8B1A4|nr:phage tail assembly protein [Methylobacterium sp. WL120]TXM68210.1 phage tail assembly protein [Methylobacterium sp. WL120]